MKKEDILDANLDSKEMEVIVLPGKPFDISKEKLIGPDSPQLIEEIFLTIVIPGLNILRRSCSTVAYKAHLLRYVATYPLF